MGQQSLQWQNKKHSLSSLSSRTCCILQKLIIVELEFSLDNCHVKDLAISTRTRQCSFVGWSLPLCSTNNHCLVSSTLCHVNRGRAANNNERERPRGVPIDLQWIDQCSKWAIINSCKRSLGLCSHHTYMVCDVWLACTLGKLSMYALNKSIGLHKPNRGLNYRQQQ